jgi:hypothetical protein
MVSTPAWGIALDEARHLGGIEPLGTQLLGQLGQLGIHVLM